MNKNNTKSEIEDKTFIRTFRENSSGAIFQFPVIGLTPISSKSSGDWFGKTLRPGLYSVSYGTEYCTGVDEKGILVQIALSNLFNKDLFTEVNDRSKDPSINWASELKNDLTKFINIKDDFPSEEDRNAIVFCKENKLETLQTIDKTLVNEGFLHVDWPYYAKDSVTQINIAFISEPKLYIRNVVSEKELAGNYVQYYIVGELRQKISADGRKHKIIVYPIYRDAGSLSSVFTLIPTKYAYLQNGNADVDDVLYDTHIKEV